MLNQSIDFMLKGTPCNLFYKMIKNMIYLKYYWTFYKKCIRFNQCHFILREGFKNDITRE